MMGSNDAFSASSVHFEIDHSSLVTIAACTFVVRHSYVSRVAESKAFVRGVCRDSVKEVNWLLWNYIHCDKRIIV